MKSVFIIVLIIRLYNIYIMTIKMQCYNCSTFKKIIKIKIYDNFIIINKKMYIINTNNILTSKNEWN